MAEEGNPEDVLPIKKTSNAVYIGGGVGAVVILGLIVGLSGGGDEAKSEKAEATEKAADAAQGMTKAELEERAAHIKKTQAALLAAEQEENVEAAQKKAADDVKRAETESQAQAAAAPAPAPSGGTAPKPAVNKKKTMSSLDGLGADITSALK